MFPLIPCNHLFVLVYSIYIFNLQSLTTKLHPEVWCDIHCSCVGRKAVTNVTYKRIINHKSTNKHCILSKINKQVYHAATAETPDG